MKKFEKYISIEGSYFDCQLTSRQLLLWDMEGSVSFYDLSDIARLKAQFDDVVPSRVFQELVQKKYDVPGKALPSDTSIMDGKLYTASEYGLFRGVAKHNQLWDARLFRLDRNASTPILAMAAGEDGLFELNVSKLPSKGLRLAESSTKDIFRISDANVYYTSYIGYNLSGSSSKDDIVALFNQQKNLREYIREIDLSETDAPFVPEGYTLDNGIAYLQDNDKLLFRQLRKGPIEGELNKVEASTEMFGGVIEVTYNELHANFEFENGLVLQSNRTELLRIAEPLTRWRTFLANNKTVEWLVVLLDDRFELYCRSLQKVEPDTTETAEPKKKDRTIYSKDIFNQIIGSEKVIKDGKTACNILKAIIRRFNGGVNIDFLDLDNWDRLVNVLYDESANLMFLVKNKPIDFEDEAHEESYRLAFGDADVFAMVVRFHEMRIIDHRGYPFVAIKASSVFPSVVKNNIQRIIGEVVKHRESIYGSDYGVRRKGRNWFVRCLNGNFMSAVILGKDIPWRMEESARLLMLENLDSIRKNVWRSTILVSRSLAESLFANNRYVLKKIDNSLYRNYRDLLKIDLAMRDVFYGDSYNERYSQDDYVTMSVIEEYRGGGIVVVREIRSIFDFIQIANTIEQYRGLHERLNELMLIYITRIEYDIDSRFRR